MLGNTEKRNLISFYSSSMIEIPIGITAGDDVISFGQIYRRFASTEHGAKLAESIRYNRYKPDEITNQEWEYILGADVNNLRHLQLTYGLTRAFIRYSIILAGYWEKTLSEHAYSSYREREDLLLASLVHDWAEAVVGDKMFDLKTQAEEDEELQFLQIISSQLYGQKGDVFLLRRIDYVVNTIIKDRNTKLGMAFNAVERVGYLRTGLRAWKKSRTAGRRLELSLQWLANNVLLNQIAALVAYAEVYPAVYLYLQENANAISEAFRLLPASVFSFYAPQEIEAKKAQFEFSYLEWNRWFATIFT